MWICPNCRQVGQGSRSRCPACGSPPKSLDNDQAVASLGFAVGACVTIILLVYYSHPNANAPGGSGSGQAMMWTCLFGGLVGGAVFTLGAAVQRGILWLYFMCRRGGSRLADVLRKDRRPGDSRQNIRGDDSALSPLNKDIETSNQDIQP